MCVCACASSFLSRRGCLYIYIISILVQLYITVYCPSFSFLKDVSFFYFPFFNASVLYTYFPCIYMHTYTYVHALGARALRQSARVSRQLASQRAALAHVSDINVWHNMNADLSLWFALETSAAAFLQRHCAAIYRRISCKRNYKYSTTNSKTSPPG